MPSHIITITTVKPANKTFFRESNTASKSELASRESYTPALWRVHDTDSNTRVWQLDLETAEAASAWVAGLANNPGLAARAAYNAANGIVDTITGV